MFYLKSYISIINLKYRHFIKDVELEVGLQLLGRFGKVIEPGFPEQSPVLLHHRDELAKRTELSPFV